MKRRSMRWIGGLLALAMCLSACEKEEKGKEPGQEAVSPGEETQVVETGPAAELLLELSPLQKAAIEGTEADLETAVTLSGLFLDLLVDENNAEGGQQNILISPTALLAGACSLKEAASGEAAEQIGSAVLRGADPERVKSLLERLEAYNDEASGNSWKMSSGVWKREGNGLDEINSWVAESTGGSVTAFEPSEAAGTELLQAVALSMRWEKPYEDKDILESRHFMNADWVGSTVDMLYSEENWYFRLSYGTGFLKNLEGGKLAFFAVMPDKDVSMDDYLVLMQVEQTDLVKALLSPSYGDVRVQLPEFSVSAERDLGDSLQTMGLTAAFDASQGAFDFGNGSPQSLGAFRQQVRFSVSRGQCAPNSDKVLKKPDAELGFPIYLNFDRPFIYGVVERESGVPILLGLVSSF
ncbi:MAG: hypothetical protein K6E50_02115 [Lachnospiraceae bacterium]|nr:hypothetical protein [Lachnospiraceae bacterium]